MTKRNLILVALVMAVALNANGPRETYAQASVPSDWQQSSTGLRTQLHPDKQTAGLGFIVQQQDWPHLILRGGAQAWSDFYRPNDLQGPIGIDLGRAKVPGTTSVFTSESTDWAHNEMTFTYGGSSPLKLWVSRLSSAVLMQSASSSLRVLAGNVTGNLFNGSSVTPRPTGPAYPKYVAYSAGGSVQVSTLSSGSFSLAASDQNWILVWYGNNSHFVNTEVPLISLRGTNAYGGVDNGGNVPQSYAYQADAPLLLVFQNKPNSIKHSSEGGIELTFASTAGYTSIMPLFGRDILRATQTEGWSVSLPANVAQKAQWWASRLCSFPVSTEESYAYDSSV